MLGKGGRGFFSLAPAPLDPVLLGLFSFLLFFFDFGAILFQWNTAAATIFLSSHFYHLLSVDLSGF